MLSIMIDQIIFYSIFSILAILFFFGIYSLYKGYGRYRRGEITFMRFILPGGILIFSPLFFVFYPIVVGFFSN
jgi:hypothetical protein